MTEKKIFAGNTLDEVAEEFASIVCQTYQKSMRMAMELSIDDYDEYSGIDKKLITQPEIVYDRTYRRILDIMRDRREYKLQFYKHYGLFYSFHIIVISVNSGFYLDIDEYNDTKKAMATNVVYVIDRWRKTITMQYYTSAEMGRLP
jgi:hypothetical protein